MQCSKKVEALKVPTAYCGPKLGVNIIKDLVVDGVGEEGDELGPGSLDAQGQGDGGQLLDGVQAQLENQKPRWCIDSLLQCQTCNIDKSFQPPKAVPIWDHSCRIKSLLIKINLGLLPQP